MTQLRASLHPFAKKFLWNLKYGILGYPRLMAPGDVLRYFSMQRIANGSLLDLGCGRGSLIQELRKAGWMGCYCGVDISKEAINDARKTADQRCSWVVSDIESFRSSLKWDTIVMVESIYYVRLELIPTLLERLLEMLEEQGALLIRLHDARKFSNYWEMIRQTCPQVEKISDSLSCIHGSNCRDQHIGSHYRSQNP
jgi:cyclopropane fatty-acyl-phospholipid synthase-like methyltransferase